MPRKNAKKTKLALLSDQIAEARRIIDAQQALLEKLRLAGAHRENRLATFSAGTVFGELALLDPGPRSASVEADQELTCYVLTEEAFEQLRKDHPHIAITLLTNLGRELSRRLRRANGTIYQLEG